MAMIKQKMSVIKRTMNEVKRKIMKDFIVWSLIIEIINDYSII